MKLALSVFIANSHDCFEKLNIRYISLTFGPFLHYFSFIIYTKHASNRQHMHKGFGQVMFTFVSFASVSKSVIIIFFSFFQLTLKSFV